jgi:hypothetical protein
VVPTSREHARETEEHVQLSSRGSH